MLPTTRLAVLLPLIAGALAACGTAPAPTTNALTPTLSRQVTSAGCEGGAFRVISGGITYQGNKGFDLPLAAGARVQVRGKYVEFDLDGDTLSTYDYTLTGAPSALDLTGGVRTPVFASKVVDLGGQKLSGSLKVQISNAGLVLTRSGGGVKVKIQANDCATGGIFQTEPETGAAVTVTHTLAPGMFYFKNLFSGKINFGNGTTFRGKDSPQVASRVSQGETVSVWTVQSGGRMGGVLGEDAVELRAGASPCVQACQAQERIRGSLPVTDPAFSN